MRDTCSPMNKPGGPGGKPSPMPHPPLNKVRHAAIYGGNSGRNDQTIPARPAPGDPDPFRPTTGTIDLKLDKR
jgi:hypothetical protein